MRDIGNLRATVPSPLVNAQLPRTSDLNLGHLQDSSIFGISWSSILKSLSERSVGSVIIEDTYPFVRVCPWVAVVHLQRIEERVQETR